MVSLPASHPPSDYDERSHLHDEFTQMTVFLQEVAANHGYFWNAFTSAAAKLKRTIEHLKKGKPTSNLPPADIPHSTQVGVLNPA